MRAEKSLAGQTLELGGWRRHSHGDLRAGLGRISSDPISQTRMTLGEKQEHFAKSLEWMLGQAHRLGYGIRLRELQRTKEQAAIYAKAGKGIRNSNHINCLAIDLYITLNGELLWDGDEYVVLAKEWKERDVPGCEHCWGGDFKNRDVYHYSIRHHGVM